MATTDSTLHNLFSLTAWKTFKEDPTQGHVGFVDNFSDVTLILREYENLSISQYVMKGKYGNIPVENIDEMGKFNLSTCNNTCSFHH